VDCGPELTGNQSDGLEALLFVANAQRRYDCRIHIVEDLGPK
jgi:hypothetical protein